jgi:hypothetical protein
LRKCDCVARIATVRRQAVTMPMEISQKDQTPDHTWLSKYNKGKFRFGVRLDLRCELFLHQGLSHQCGWRMANGEWLTHLDGLEKAFRAIRRSRQEIADL